MGEQEECCGAVDVFVEGGVLDYVVEALAGKVTGAEGIGAAGKTNECEDTKEKLWWEARDWRSGELHLRMVLRLSAVHRSSSGDCDCDGLWRWWGGGVVVIVVMTTLV